MRRWGAVSVYAVLVALAVAMGLAVRQSPQSPVPSVDNPGPQGLAVLRTWLEETGGRALAWRESLATTPLPEPVRTLVVASPKARAVSAEEVRALRAWVQGGGTLVYLAPREREPGVQPLDEWLEVRPGPLAASSSEGLPPGERDMLGTTAQVWMPVGPLQGVKALRVVLDRGLEVYHPEAVPLAGAGRAVVAWRVAEGKGEVYVLAGTDVAENQRLELLGNLQWWEGLAARGVVAFDEYHHEAAAAAPLAARWGLWVFAGQLLVVGLVYLAARGTRFGPARPLGVERHRSALEYVQSLGWLARRSRVERELVPELARQLRWLMHERLGIPVALPEEEAARELEARCGVPAAEYLEAQADLAHTLAQRNINPADYARLARRYARLEDMVAGRRVT